MKMYSSTRDRSTISGQVLVSVLTSENQLAEIDDSVVEVVASEESLTRRHPHLEDAVLDRQECNSRCPFKKHACTGSRS